MRRDQGALRPRARLLSTIGEDLISSESVALIELVKNAYDADASHVVIRLIGPLTEGAGGVEVLDDGEGMSFEQIRDTWLQPATEYRKAKTRSASGRRVLGEKGIGRFAASKLADRMLLVSRRQDAPEVQLALDWSDFRSSDRFLDEIEVLWEEGPPAFFAEDGPVGAAWAEIELEARPQGTLLRLDDLRADWNEETIRKLRIDLSRLISARSLTSEGVPDFQVTLLPPAAFDQYSGPVEPPRAIQKAPYELVGSVDALGRARIVVTVPDLEPVSDEFDLTADNEPLMCGPFDIRLRVWDRDAAAMREQAGEELTARDFRSLLDAAAGVSVYRDGFRVFPYGEDGNDWLRLDKRRVQNPSLRVSNNQIVGEVHISAEGNPLLRDQSNREGLVAGAAYDTFLEVVQQLLAQLEVRRRNRRQEGRPQSAASPTNIFESFTVDDIVTEATSRGVDEQIVGMLAQRGRELAVGVEHVRDVLGRYSRLATLGKLVDDINHDGQHAAGAIRDGLSEARRSLRIDTACEEKLTLIERELVLAVQQLDTLSALFRRIQPFGGRRRGRPAHIELTEVVRDAVAVLASRAARQETELTVEGDVGEVSIDPDEVREIVVNLVENALYWVRTTRSSQRVVRVRTEWDGDAACVVVSDTGPGVPDEFQEAIFDPYFTTKPEGVGLGLAITGQLLSDHYDGSLELLDSELGGSTFRACFRRRT